MNNPLNKLETGAKHIIHDVEVLFKRIEKEIRDHLAKGNGVSAPQLTASITSAIQNHIIVPENHSDGITGAATEETVKPESSATSQEVNSGTDMPGEHEAN